MIKRAAEGAARMFRAIRLGGIASAVLAAPVAALELSLPDGATIVAATPPDNGMHRIATGTWDGTGVPTSDVSGIVRAAAWQLPSRPDLTIASLASGIEQQLLAQGYLVELSCADTGCGGFDFRHRLDMGQSPEMHVDIGNFRYVAARHVAEGDWVAVTVSHGALTLYVHVVHVGDGAGDEAWVTSSTRAPITDTADVVVPTGGPQNVDPIAQLLDAGAVPLDDLSFRTGASELSGNAYASLASLAAFLAEDSGRRVVLVGHTDAEGGRESNIALSEARAEAVRRHLIDVLGVNPGQLDAAGIGYLAPRATNETAGGREANRRVEVVLLDGG
jgi:outer membrane protein OmpA-like peptidoglycan-associated protein